MTYTILDGDTRRKLDRLCELGARPRIIAALLPKLTDYPSIIAAHWRYIQGRAPSKGGTTTRATSYLSTTRIRLHASFALATYLEIETTRIDYVDAYIKAYEEYLTVFSVDAPESFDWFHGLVRNYLDGHIDLVVCTHCNTRYAHNVDDLVNHRNCPSHKIISSEPKKSKPQYMENGMLRPDLNDDLFAPLPPEMAMPRKEQKQAL